MAPYKFAAAAALLASVRSVAAVGSTTITNQCSYPVYLWSVAETAGVMHTLSSNGGSYSETYRTNGDGGGISIKMSNKSTLYGSAITQFEYTLDGMIWYDISNINGYPFSNGGLKLTPSVASCPAVACTAGVGACSAVYNVPDDNEATKACADTADLDMVLCPGGGSDSSPAPAPAPIAAPVETTKAAPKPSKKKKPAPAPAPETTTEAPPPPAPETTTQAAPAPAPTTTSADEPAVVKVTTMVTQVVTAPVNDVQQPAPSTDDDWWIGHYPASWASFPVPTIGRRDAKPTAHAHHHQHHARHAHHGHHHRRR